MNGCTAISEHAVIMMGGTSVQRRDECDQRSALPSRSYPRTVFFSSAIMEKLVEGGVYDYDMIKSHMALKGTRASLPGGWQACLGTTAYPHGVVQQGDQPVVDLAIFPISTGHQKRGKGTGQKKQTPYRPGSGNHWVRLHESFTRLM